MRAMPLRMLVSIAAGVAALLAVTAVPATAADVDSLPNKVTVNATEDVFVTLETNYDNPDTEEVESTCTDTWTTRVLGGTKVIKPIAAPECDGMSTWWTIGTRRGAKPTPKTTAIVEFTRTGPDGNVVSVQRLTVKVIVPKKGSGGAHGGGANSDGFATCASAGQNCVGTG